MDAVSYGTRRYRLYYGSAQGVEGYALEQAYALFQAHLPYILTALGPEAAPDAEADLVLMGTPASSPALAEAARRGFIALPEKNQGYSAYMGPSPWNPERDAVILAGADPAGLLYALRDFEHEMMPELSYRGAYWVKTPEPLAHPLPAWRKDSFPAISDRGVWCWGHTLYDYEAFLDEMSRFKLNELILWNDFVPVNAARVVEAARRRGIQIVWGFSWCWGEAVHPEDAQALETWSRRVLEQCAAFGAVGCDGVYFQIFTETQDKELDGRSIAAMATAWVNALADRVLACYPNLWIQFGLHATSVYDRLDEIEPVDPRVNITWEDCGGFPYHYDPRKNWDEATRLFTRQIAGLRGREDFGAVFKGMTCLDWPHFEHQKGPFVLGVTTKAWREEKYRRQRFLWRQADACWLEKAKDLKDCVRILRDTPLARRSVTGLAEDGMLEAGMPLSLALMAEALWDPEQDVAAKVLRCPDVDRT